ncbi:Hsp70 family protein [Actinoplanes sp. GCM10030250]|uniref:Hsp70 family protein n=1 Tax=Actinoplanes sp. GCM10030250 TaxID=3273376 RepID=UPI003607739F
MCGDALAIFCFTGAVTPSLVIDYGAAITRAVLIRADGSWVVLQFDGGWWLSSAVHVSAGQVSVGAEAWRRAATDPDGFVLSPLRAGTGHVEVAGVTVEVAELAAATLRQVAAEAARVAGDRVERVQMLIPAGWGPRRRTWFQHAARLGGLHVSQLMEVPVAAALRTAPAVAASEDAERLLLIIDIGAGCEVTVLRQSSQQTGVLSTLHDQAAGGDRIDALLTAALTGTPLDDLPAGQRWTTLATVRIMQQSLAEQVAVTVPMPGSPGPVIVTHAHAMQAVQPVLERAGELAADAVAAADLTLAEVHGVHLIGGVAALPGAAELIAAKLGVVPQVSAQPNMVAVTGAADANPSVAAARSEETEEPLRLPPLRRLLLLGVPALMSLLLYAFFLGKADMLGSQPFSNYRPLSSQVYAAWPQLTVAVMLVQLGLLQAASVFAALLDQNPHMPGRTGSISRITAALGITVVVGPVIAYIYALVATAYFNGAFTKIADWTVQWAVWPSLPVAVCTALLAVAAARRRLTPAGGWDGFLSFPASSLIFATAGAVISAYWSVIRLPEWLWGWGPALNYIGEALFAVAIACTVVQRLSLRVGLSIVLALPVMVVAQGWWGYRMLGFFYTAAVVVWLLTRLWVLLAGRR